MAKLNNGRFVNRTMCVGLRPTTAFSPSPLSFPCPHYTQDREIACNWLWIDCGWQGGVLCVCCNDIWRRTAGRASSQTSLECLFWTDRLTGVKLQLLLLLLLLLLLMWLLLVLLVLLLVLVLEAVGVAVMAETTKVKGTLMIFVPFLLP